MPSRGEKSGTFLEIFLPSLVQLVIFYVMMPLAFWDSTRNGLSCLLT